MGKTDRGSLTAKQSLLVGVTLFSMFFGAGNLILPPLLGVQAGAETVPAMIGFFITGVGLPVLGVVVAALTGTVGKLASRVHPVFSAVFVAAIYLAIGPCLAIPRTSSTAFEMLVPLLPQGLSVEVARLVFSIGFFAVAFFLALHPGRLTRLLGRVTGPALILLIAAVVLSALMDPAAAIAPAQGSYAEGAAITGFLTGYQTMDLLASLTFGIVIATNVREMGVADPGSVARAVSRSGVIAGALMMLLYGGLAVVGVNLSAELAGATNGAAVLTFSAARHYGAVGTVVVAAIFLLACLNVCIGLISCCGEYFSERIPRISYRACAFVFAAFSCFVSNFGLDAILTFSVPLLNALYPIAIVLVIMGLAYRVCDRVRFVWPCAVGLVAVVSVVTSVRDAFLPAAVLPFDALPLADMGMNWVVPAVIGIFAGIVLSLAIPSARAGRGGSAGR